MGRCGDHLRDRTGQFASQLLSGIPGHHGGRGTEKTPRADGQGASGRGGTGSAGDADRPGRRHPSVGRQLDPRRRTRHRGAGFPCQRSQHDGRVLPGREAARRRRRRCPACRAEQHRVSWCLSSKRNGEGAGRSDRSPDGIRRHRRTASGTPARDRFCAWCPAVRLSADPSHGGDRPFRADGEPASAPPSDRIAAVRRGAGGGPVAGTAACHHQRHAFGRRARHGQTRGDRAAAGCHRKPRQHEHPVHGQDRHADRRDHRAQRGARYWWPALGRGAATGLYQCLARDWHRESVGCCHRRGGQHRRTDEGWPDQDRRDPLRLRAPAADNRGWRGGHAGTAFDRDQGGVRGRARQLRGVRARWIRGTAGRQCACRP